MNIRAGGWIQAPTTILLVDLNGIWICTPATILPAGLIIGTGWARSVGMRGGNGHGNGTLRCLKNRQRVCHGPQTVASLHVGTVPIPAPTCPSRRTSNSVPPKILLQCHPLLGLTILPHAPYRPDQRTTSDVLIFSVSALQTPKINRRLSSTEAPPVGRPVDIALLSINDSESDHEAAIWRDILLPPPPVQSSPLSTPIHQQFWSTRSIDEERWEVVDPATGLARPHTPPRGAPEGAMMQNGGEQQQQQEDKKEKKGFWGGGGRDKEKEREHQRAMEMEQREREFQLQQQQQRTERGREQREDNELARKIGFLTATASEDWTLVLDVCDQASSSESNAKEAVRALRREFKYGEPAAQLATARLWAIMLRNSSDTFISQSTSRKFLDTLEDLLTSARTSPVVRERVMDVVAAAAYATGSKKDAGFRGLWRRVKPRDKPEEGVPFDTEDAMFNPPLGPPAPARPYEYHTDGNNLTNSLIANASTDNLATPPLPYYPTPISATTSDIDVVGAGGEEETSENTGHREHRDREHWPAWQRELHDWDRGRERSKRKRIIPPDEDMRRLFQECKIGRGNAELLSHALANAAPEDL
ncbi:hypothetical protein C8J57DRAFT_1480377, partial [Mycena rebaudengoi]